LPPEPEDPYFVDLPFEWPAYLQYFSIKAADDLEVQCFSSGPKSKSDRKGTIFFAHGFPETAASWKDYVVHFGSRGFHALACDLRNVNNSVSTSGMSFSIDQLADDLKGIADSVGEDKIAVVGHDWGAAAVQAFAMKYPHSVSAAVILAVPHIELYRWYNVVRLPVVIQHVWYFLFCGLTGPVARWKVAKDDFGWSTWFFLGGTNPGAFTKSELERLKKLYSRSMTDPASSTVTTWYWMGCMWLLKGMLPPGMVSGIVASMWSSYTPITAPTLQLHGVNDGFVTADEMIAANPDQSVFFPHPKSKYKLYPEATHFVNHEFKADVIAEITAFFDQVLE